jgi:hypothetical protein
MPLDGEPEFFGRITVPRRSVRWVIYSWGDRHGPRVPSLPREVPFSGRRISIFRDRNGTMRIVEE